jgi:hypothetical protein
MSGRNQLITIIQSGRIGYFTIGTENVLLLASVELHELGMAEIHEAPTKIDEGNLNISSKSLAFSGYSNTISMPLSNIVRMQPYENAIDIYEKGRKKAHRFVWGKSINMKLVGFPGDDGKEKPLSGRIVAQFIINERTNVRNLLKSK